MAESLKGYAAVQFDQHLYADVRRADQVAHGCQYSDVRHVLRVWFVNFRPILHQYEQIAAGFQRRLGRSQGLATTDRDSGCDAGEDSTSTQRNHG